MLWVVMKGREKWMLEVMRAKKAPGWDDVAGVYSKDEGGVMEIERLVRLFNELFVLDVV